MQFQPGSNATTYTLYAGTAGVNSELATSTDANSFWGVGMFSVSNYNNVAIDKFQGFGGPTVLLYMTDTALLLDLQPTNDAMLFTSTDGGIYMAEEL